MKLMSLSNFARLSEDNETMHVVVISHIAKKECEGSFIFGTLMPLLFAFGYFWVAYWLYLINHRYALELNYLFESHAHSQYEWFLKENEAKLKGKNIESEYLKWYGRTPANQYEFFESVRNDELIHRTTSVEKIRDL